MTTEQIIDDVASFEAAVADDRFDDAADLLDRLASRYDDARPAETTLVERALVAREQADGIDQVDRLTEFVQSKAAAATSRSAVLSGAAGYLSDPEAADPDRLVSVASNLRTLEERLLERTDEVRDDLAGVEIPACVVVLGSSLPEGPYLTGQSYDLTVTVANVGDAPASDVEASLDPEDGLGIDPTTVAVGDLGAGAEATATFSITVREAGSYVLSIAASGADTRESLDRKPFEGVDKATLVAQALDGVERLRDRVEGADVPNSRPLVAKLETAIAKLGNAQDELDAGREKQADNQLRAAANALGAFLNQLEASGNGKGKKNGSKLSTSLRQALTTGAEAAIEQLSLARTAV